MTRTPLWWAAPSSEPPTPETVEYVAMRLYEQQICDNSFLRIPWTELDDDEREDVRYQVRSVFDVVEILSPGLLGELGPVVSGACDPRRLPARGRKRAGSLAPYRHIVRRSSEIYVRVSSGFGSRQATNTSVDVTLGRR